MSKKFSISLVCVDSYQSAPLPDLDITFSDFRGADIRHVPVVRIFGSTSTGTKTCLHIHGVFPYIYVPCAIEKDVDSYAYRLAAALDSAINVSLGSAMSKNQHVYKIQQVSGIPLYGYHEKEHLFFKIYFYNPAMIKRAAELLQNGSVMSQSLQPHEAHIPFILQFMIDYNLYGMSVINLMNVKHRKCTFEASKENSQSNNSLQRSNSQEYLPDFIIRQSVCELEVDTKACDILNRQEILEGLELNPGIAAIWNNEKARREAKGLQQAASQLVYSKTPTSADYPQTENDIYQEERLARRLQLISQANDTTTSLSTSDSNYPLEVESENSSLNASHILNHFKPSESKEESMRNMLANVSPLKFDKSELSQKMQTSIKDTDTSFLDMEDMQLLEMLANLPEENEPEKIIDDDSVLGSQYSGLSTQVKEVNEDEEVEDLNLTSLDLDSLVSWDSIKVPSQSNAPETNAENKNVHSSKESTNAAEDNIEDGSLLNFPQFDGACDLIVEQYFPSSTLINTISSYKTNTHLSNTKAIDYHEVTEALNTANIIVDERISTNVFGKHCREFKSKRKKVRNLTSTANRVSDYNTNMLKLCQLEHRDLDVYDFDSADYTLDATNDAIASPSYRKRYTVQPDQSFKKYSTTYDWNSSYSNQKHLSINLKIPALDGNTVNSSSDSEPDPDITIDRQEKRICAYKAGTKSTPRDVINTTPRKRMRRTKNSDFESPSKRRNIEPDALQSPTRSPARHTTPRKKRMPQSPQNSTRKYTPLAIVITSPRSNKNPIVVRDETNSEPSSPRASTSTACDTPKRKSQLLRVQLLREKSYGPSPQTSRANSDEEADNINQRCLLDELYTIEDEEHICNTDKRSESIDFVEDSVLTQTSNENRTTPKSNKEVRKKLSFVCADIQNGDALENVTHERHCENLAENLINESNEESDSADCVIESDDIKSLTNVHERKDENDLINVSRANTNSHISSIIDLTITPDEENHRESDTNDDLCNMTFTQYISKKLEVDSQPLSTDSVHDTTAERVVTITTRFNPPSRQRIVDSMKTYGMAECKSLGPFFGNKLDLIKHKEGSNKNSNIHDLLPFKSSLERVTGIKLWRRVKVNEFHPSGSSIKSCDMKRALAGYNSLVIRPLINPPLVNHVKTWLRAKQYLWKQDNKNKKSKTAAVKENKAVMTDLVSDNPTGNRNKVDSVHVDVVDSNKEDAQTSSVEQQKINSLSRNDSTITEQCVKSYSQNSNNSEHSNASSDVNPSLRNALENSLLYKNIETPQHLGISYGQIDYSVKGNSYNIDEENLQNAKAVAVYQYLTILSLEVHVVTRGELLPDPEHDCLEALFYAIYHDAPVSLNLEQMEHGAIIMNTSGENKKLKRIHTTNSQCSILYVVNEQEMLNNLIKLVRQCNPDILVGWEIETLSWGYVIQRAIRIGFKNFTWQISRIPNATPAFGGHTADKDNPDDAKVPGRIVLDVWRIMRHEAALLNYTFENVMYHFMHERISCPTFRTLTDWWKHISTVVHWRVISHYVVRVLGTLRLLIHLDVIGRTSEHARLFGIQFYEVFSRGSQFRVESMMLRLAKPLNYIPISPSVHQRAKMRAPESLPLIMEPQSIFYTDPVVVLDFQSLYPSIIIAYNYCFSTCLGRIEHIGQYDPFEFGAATLRVKKSAALKLQGKMSFSPTGIAYVTRAVRQGILPRMLTEILNTRLMVKESMKLHDAENRVLQRVLHSQQLGLKLIANVTYGYTSANFSGRMPCIEIGDSVVSKGRETLERAIKIVESTPKWGAQVVYGDTDSIFVLLPGKSKEEAFSIGAEMADVITAANPPPVKLKFEKVLYPSILQTKKRYCGYMYESLKQEKPEYLAKGIETVRRDGCPAVAKILEKCLKILFDTKDVSLLKLYITRQFDKILRRKISIQDLTFAKEFRGLSGYKAAACVPALELTRRLIRKDPRAVPRTGERVRYVIVAGAPNQALIQCVRTPMEVISDEGLIPNSIYYITKVIIPPLNRCFNLIGVDVNVWYREMSHRQTPDKAASLFVDNQKSTIRQFFSTIVCAACGEQTKREICANCIARPSQTITILHEKIRWLERTYHGLTTICQSCTGYLDEPKCESLDCPVLYRLIQARRDLVQVPYLTSIIDGSGNTSAS